MKTLFEYLIKDKIKKYYSDVKQVRIKPEQKKYYKSVILAYNDIFNSFDTQEKKDDWFREIHAGEFDALQKLLNTIQKKYNNNYSEEDIDLIFKNIWYNVLMAFWEYKDTDKVLYSFGIK